MQPIITKVLALLKAGIGESAGIKSFYEGDPIAPPAANLPCLYVEPGSSETRVGPTGMDECFYTFRIGVIIDKRDEINKNPAESPIQKKLVDLVEGRNSDRTYRDDSVFGILRKNFTLSSIVTDQQLKADYGIGKREEIITAESMIEARVSELVIVDGRS